MTNLLLTEIIFFGDFNISPFEQFVYLIFFIGAAISFFKSINDENKK